MIPRSVSAPMIPLPFHKLLKVVAIFDAIFQKRVDGRIKVHTYAVRE